MTESVELFVDGNELVRVVRMPLAQDSWSDEVITQLREWWNSDSRRYWAFLPPSVRFQTLVHIAFGIDDPLEAVTRVQIGLIPDLPEDVRDGTRDYLWSVIGHEEFGHELVWEQMGTVLLECAAEATAEIAAGTHSLHEWRAWFRQRVEELPGHFLRAVYEALRNEYAGIEEIDWEDLTCECCGDRLSSLDALRHSFLSQFISVFRKTMLLLSEKPDVFDGHDEYDYSISA